MNADSVTAFARPLQRKEKKDMDLRRWKDMLSRDEPASTHGPQQSRRVKIIETTPLSVASADAPATSSNTLLAQKPARASYQRDIVSPPLAVSSSPSNGLGTRQASSSLESDIDVENHARLQTMSPEEIAEAQAELLDKMDPALLSILKKRGEAKLKKRKHSVQGVSITHETAKNSRTDGHFVTPQVMPIPEEKTVLHKSAIAQGFVWDTWTERVEAARDLRFSFDGNVVEDDVLVSPAETGE